MSKQDKQELEQPILENKELETHTDKDKAEFLDELESDFDPQIAIDKAEEKVEAVNAQKLALQAAEETVLVGAGMADFAVKEMLDERLEIGEDNAHALAKAAAPVILKYNVSPPPWAVKYKEEISLGVVALSIGASLYMQYRGLKKADKQAAIDATKEAQEEKEQHTAH
ncbi:MULTISPECIES: hypothetical protein [unclassified Vibrio]|uniref:hypothetical protein n=1 Tax=unclassified Vibrio TaxID=2614977 RepID=UPI00352DECDE